MDVQFADLLTSDPQAERVWTECSHAETTLSPAARREFYNLMLRVWKFLEGQYWAHRLGSIRNSEFKSQASGATAMYRVPAVQEYFSERRMMYSAEFIEFLQTGKLESDVVQLSDRLTNGSQ
jgi:hypothetical protein